MKRLMMRIKDFLKSRAFFGLTVFGFGLYSGFYDGDWKHAMILIALGTLLSDSKEEDG